jgi:Ca2+/Na+ antiporter
MNVVVQVGLVLLAVGALSGWAVMLKVAFPGVLRRAGVRSPRRLLQAHIDFVMMGVILIAVGTALPDLATWIRVLLIAGTIVNPSLFLPLAWRESIADTLAYRAVTVLSFSAMSVATVAAAVTGLTA